MTARSYLIVGHGGQGVLDLGNFIAYHALLNGLHVAYTPSYGPETRGGKVRCYVVESSDEIESPIVDEPDVLVAMNNPSMDFEQTVRQKGSLLMNSSLIDRTPTRQDLDVMALPATEIADTMREQIPEIADTRVLQNSVTYGALLAITAQPYDMATVRSIIEHVYTGTKARFAPANIVAVERGYNYVVSQRKDAQPLIRGRLVLPAGRRCKRSGRSLRQ